MRLFRRTLLCLVVGVTAFGVAGWLLRPKPRWEVEIPSTADFVYVPDRTRSSPIWLSLRDDKYNWLTGSFVALAPETGAVQWTLRPPPDFVFMRDVVPLAEGRFLVKAHLPLLKKRMNFLRTWFAVVDPKRLSCDLERTLEGKWEPASNGDRAWMIASTPGGFKLLGKRLSDGAMWLEFPFATGYSRFKHEDVAVSPNGKTLLICESVKDQPGDGFEIWNVFEKKLVGRRALPAKRSIREPLRAASPDFRSDRVALIRGALVSGEAKPYERWKFDVERGEFIEDWSPTPPPADSPLVTQEEESQTGESIWTAYHRNGGPFGWFSVCRGDRQLREWRKVPYRYTTVGYIGLDGGADYGMNVYAVPGRDEFVAMIWRETLRDTLPEALHDVVEDYLDIDRNPERYYWHDWKTNSWRDVGCPDGDVMSQVREDALLSVRKRDDERTVLQSWPLPPRDPKWPALGVSALCVAATWWVCARWYARRQSLDA